MTRAAQALVWQGASCGSSGLDIDDHDEHSGTDETNRNSWGCVWRWWHEQPKRLYGKVHAVDQVWTGHRRPLWRTHMYVHSMYGEKNQIRAPGRWIACLAEGNSWSAVHVRRKQIRVADMRLVVATCSGLWTGSVSLCSEARHCLVSPRSDGVGPLGPCGGPGLGRKRCTPFHTRRYHCTWLAERRTSSLERDSFRFGNWWASFYRVADSNPSCHHAINEGNARRPRVWCGWNFITEPETGRTLRR